MKRNVGTFDRRVRALVIAPLAIVVGLVVGPSSVLGLVLFVVAIVMLATSAFSFCPLYRVSGLSSCGSRKAD